MRNVKYTAQYLSTPTQQACDAQMNFMKTPSASTAMEYALSYRHYLDNHAEGSNSVDTYPLMIFINHDKSTYMIYSDIIKDWFTIGYDGEDRIIHALDTFGSYGKAGVFQFISDGSSYLFDATFHKPVITDIRENKIQNPWMYSTDQCVPQIGVLIFH